MSHFAVMVIGSNVEEQLAKYDENIEYDEYDKGEVSEEDKNNMLNYYSNKQGESFSSFDECYQLHGEDWNGNRWKLNEDGEWHQYSTYNPYSKWDWYSIGGRFSGMFITHVKDGVQDMLNKDNFGECGVFCNKVGIDSIQKKYIDFEAIRKEAEDAARKKYKEVAACFTNGVIPKLEYTWKQVLEMDNLSNIEEKRNFYFSQPLVGDFKKRTAMLRGYIDIEDFQRTEEEYVKDAGDNSFVPFAVVKDGEWYERGEMGWWAIVTNEKKRNEWRDIVKHLLDETDDDDLITFVDCHI